MHVDVLIWCIYGCSLEYLKQLTIKNYNKANDQTKELLCDLVPPGNRRYNFELTLYSHRKSTSMNHRTNWHRFFSHFFSLSLSLPTLIWLNIRCLYHSLLAVVEIFTRTQWSTNDDNHIVNYMHRGIWLYCFQTTEFSICTSININIYATWWLV